MAAVDRNELELLPVQQVVREAEVAKRIRIGGNAVHEIGVVFAARDVPARAALRPDDRQGEVVESARRLAWREELQRLPRKLNRIWFQRVTVFSAPGCHIVLNSAAVRQSTNEFAGLTTTDRLSNARGSSKKPTAVASH